MISILLAAAIAPKTMPETPQNLRPIFHYAPSKDWLNDPNGLVYFRGTWHLFYQYATDLRGGSDKHWAYVTSRDLTHWKERGLVFSPDRDGAVWSGGAAVDWENSTGFGKNGVPPLVGMYTAAGRFNQCLVYSDDGGKSWHKYPKPVIDHIVAENRDPRPVWYAPTKNWVTALYLDNDQFAFFGSKDMKSWKELSRLHVPGSSECPDIFELPIERSKGEKCWVFFGGNYRYLIGTFDGKEFKPEVGPIQGDYGNAFYASQTWSDGPGGRRVQIAWMFKTEPFPGAGYTGQMSFPCELKLRRTAEGLRVFRNPVKEIAKRYKRTQEWSDLAAGSKPTVLMKNAGDALDLEVEFALGKADSVGLEVRGAKIEYRDGQVTCLGRSMPVKPKGGKLKLRVLLDRTTVEVFASDGLVSMTSYFLPEAGAVSVSGRVVRAVLREIE